MKIKNYYIFKINNKEHKFQYQIFKNINKIKKIKFVSKKKSYLLKIFLFIIFTTFFSLFVKNNFYSSQNLNFINIKYFKNKYEALNKSYSNEIIKILTLGKIYINECLNGSFINNNHKLSITDKTVISSIIPIYNCEKTIKSAIRSIQNQNLSDIEIILVNDFSKDNSLKIIENLKKEDKRIIIINNKKNMGTLYSRCIGSLMSKGEYIFALDNDDMFFYEDIFDFVYKKAKEGNFDIIGFKSIYITNYNDNITKMRDGYFSHHPNNLIIYQPKLGIYPISLNGRYMPNDYTIWAKCIKTEVYIKAINSLGIKRYSSFLSWAEDTSIVFIIFNIANSFKFIHKYGIIHLRSFSTSTFTQPMNNILLGEIFLLEIIFDFSKNNTDKNFAAVHALYIKRRYNLKKYMNDINILCLKNILKKIINCKYISESFKNRIKQNFKDIIP